MAELPIQEPLIKVYLRLLQEPAAPAELQRLLQLLPETLQQLQEAVPALTPYAQRSQAVLRQAQARLDDGAERDNPSWAWLHQRLLQALHQALPGSPLPQLP